MEYWIIIDETQQGPFTLEQLKEKNIDPDTPVWHEGLADWIPAIKVSELDLQPVPPIPVTQAVYEPGLVPTPPVADTTVTPEVNAPIEAPTASQQPIAYAPADAIPAGYVPVIMGEPKCPPSYLVWAILTTILCFMPLGIVAIICAVKVKSHFKAGRLDKAFRMSERAALFVILSFVVALIWIPFSIVFAML